MRGSFKPFLLSFLLTLGVLAPFVWCGLLYYDHSQPDSPAGKAQSGVPVANGAQESLLILLALAPWEESDLPSIALLRLDCPHGRITACPLPAETVLRAPSGAVTLQESYLTAGPGRAVQLLGETLEMPLTLYIAATPQGWNSLLEEPSLRFDTSSLLQSEQYALLEIEGAVLDLGVEQAASLCALGKAALPDPQAAALRNAVWESALQQTRPGWRSLSENMRAQSSRLLTNFSATDLLRLEKALSYLSQADGVQISVQSMPGEKQGSRFALNEESLAFAAELAA